MPKKAKNRSRGKDESERKAEARAKKQKGSEKNTALLGEAHTYTAAPNTSTRAVTRFLRGGGGGVQCGIGMLEACCEAAALDDRKRKHH